MTGITGLAGVIIHTGQFETMRRFYGETLGLAERHVRAGFVNFAWGDVRLTITAHSEIRGTSLDGLRVVVNFTTEDIHGMHEQLAAAGVSFLRTPSREPWGLVATFLDPDGNAVQLFQFDR